jgi:hypothetical protein
MPGRECGFTVRSRWRRQRHVATVPHMGNARGSAVKLGLARRLAWRPSRRGSNLRRSLHVAAVLMLVVTSITVPAVAVASGPGAEGGNLPYTGNSTPVATSVPVAPIYSNEAWGAGLTLPATGGVTLRQPYSRPTAPRVKTELTDRRTDRTSTYANPDGSYTVESSPVRLHYKDSYGVWQEIDTTLVPSLDPAYDVQTKADDVRLSVSKGNGSSGIARLIAG